MGDRVTVVIREYNAAADRLVARLRALGFDADPWVGAVADIAALGDAAGLILLDPAAVREHATAVAALENAGKAPVVHVTGGGLGDAHDAALDLGADDARLKAQLEALLTALRVGRGAAAAPVPPRRAEPLGYEDFLAYASDAIYIADPTGRYIAANERAAQMLGYARDELVGMHMRDVLPPEDLEAAPFQFGKMEAKKPILIERRLRRSDGRIFPAEISAVVLPDGNLLGIVRDISVRKEAEQMLRESEERYRQMFETNPAVKIVIDPETGRIVDANPAACAFYGYPFEQLTQMRIFEINQLAEEDIRAEMEAAKREKRLYFVFPHKIAGGEVRWVEIYSGPLTLGGKRYLHSIIHDITERRRAEEMVRASERYFRAVIENASDIVTIVDDEGVIRYESPSVTRVSGFNVEELHGLNIFSFLHQEDLPAVEQAFIALLREPDQIQTLELRVRHKGGGWVWLEATACNLLAEPAVKGIVINSRDVTLRKQADAALRERTEELERLNQFMVDRELRMVELKKELADLRAELADVYRDKGETT